MTKSFGFHQKHLDVMIDVVKTETEAKLTPAMLKNTQMNAKVCSFKPSTKTRDTTTGYTTVHTAVCVSC